MQTLSGSEQAYKAKNLTSSYTVLVLVKNHQLIELSCASFEIHLALQDCQDQSGFRISARNSGRNFPGAEPTPPAPRFPLTPKTHSQFPSDWPVSVLKRVLSFPLLGAQSDRLTPG